LIAIGTLILATVTVMAYAGRFTATPPAVPPTHRAQAGIVTLAGHLVQGSVFTGSDGRAGLELILTAEDVFKKAAGRVQGADLAVVLDRSGSMQGEKLENARQALLHLLSGLGEADRFALFSYANGIQKHCDFLPVSGANRALIDSAIRSVFAGGGTNLGAGLGAGIDLMRAASRPGRPGRVILISDGLANQGIVDPGTLAGMAAAAAGREFAVSTVGVGADFNEFLMTLLAERGAGNYYYLENPAAFAEVFQKEFLATSTAAATGMKVSVSLPEGARLTDAAGYPVSMNGNTAVFYPGSLRSGQTRRLFLTFQVPTAAEARFDISRIALSFVHQGETHEAVLERTFTIACVADEKAALSSIDPARWERKVLGDDYSRLKQEVAADIKAGDKDGALKRIDRYRRERQAVNAVVKSDAVGKNLAGEVTELEARVDKTFEAPAAAQNAEVKALQYEGYSGRRK
jgi:Ca-activated chloride channel family protein